MRIVFDRFGRLFVEQDKRILMLLVAIALLALLVLSAGAPCVNPPH